MSPERNSFDSTLMVSAEHLASAATTWLSILRTNLPFVFGSNFPALGGISTPFRYRPLQAMSYVHRVQTTRSQPSCFSVIDRIPTPPLSAFRSGSATYFDTQQRCSL